MHACTGSQNESAERSLIVSTPLTYPAVLLRNEDDLEAPAADSAAVSNNSPTTNTINHQEAAAAGSDAATCAPFEVLSLNLVPPPTR